MRKINYLSFSLIGIFLSLIIIFNITAQPVKADTYVNGIDYTFDDGITNWSGPKSVSNSDEISLNPRMSLGYGFGNMYDTSGKYSNIGFDDSVSKDSMNTGSTNSYYSKMTGFLVDSNNNYISSIFNSGYASTDPATRKQGTGSTSPDFLIVPSTFNLKSNSVSVDKASILTGGDYKSSNNGSSTLTGLHDKKLYSAQTTHGLAFKLVGVLTRSDSTYGTYNMTVELLLRPSPTNAALVQREMYIRNNSTTTASFQTFFGEDTKLGMLTGGVGADAVPIYDLGGGHGIYIGNGTYRINVTNETPDGFDNYTAINRVNAQNWAVNYKTGTDGTVTGDEVNSATNAGKEILNTQDSAYSLRWNPVTIKEGETAHFGSTFGETQSPYALPSPSKTYTNENKHSDNKNYVGDTLKFNLKMQNMGYSSSTVTTKWAYNKLVDVLPAGLQYKPDSVSIDGAAYDSSKVDYDSATRTLTITPGESLAESQISNITFEANITNDASGQTITNTGNFFGRDMNISPLPSTDSQYNASVSIPVENSKFGYTFTKQVKKSTDSNYQNSIDASAGDTVNYKAVFAVSSGSNYTSSLNSGSTISDTLPSGLDLVKGSVNLTDSNGTAISSNGDSLSGLQVGSVAPGSSVILTFNAKVNQSTAGTITNTALLNNAKTSTGATLGDLTSTSAVINVQNSESFISVPDIGFGSVNMSGTPRTLNNVSTSGGLVIAHPNSGDYSVNVAYDNNDTSTQMKSGSNTLSNDDLASDGSGLLYIRQRTNKASDVGRFVPISPSGTPIQTDFFDEASSSIPLTPYVGIGDWQIKLGSNTKEGSYNGTLTWTMVDSNN